MKPTWVVLAALIAVAVARPQKGGDADAVVVRAEYSNEGLGQYKYEYETSNGIKAEESGEVKNLGPEDQPIVARGSFSFVAADGQTYTVTYIADENGFQPLGAHLPQPQ